ncbi:hypothetical protein AA103581_0466 [Gluconobacter wancherniae NBRC 103581]|nr:hypothetical protein AA103581_0466 [Gluconobacter wancherniae NBRC 103581]
MGLPRVRGEGLRGGLRRNVRELMRFPPGILSAGTLCGVAIVFRRFRGCFRSGLTNMVWS